MGRGFGPSAGHKLGRERCDYNWLEVSLNSIKAEPQELFRLSPGDISQFIVPPWRESGVVHGFLGGDLDFRSNTESWNAFQLANAFQLPLQLLKQTHSSDIVVTEGAQSSDGVLVIGEGDGLILDRRGSPQAGGKRAIGVITADCVPVLIWSPSSPIVAAVHCGWRGAVGGILPKTIKQLKALVGDLEIAIGPAAQRCCYEIGEDLVSQLLAAEDLVTASGESRSVVRTQVGVYGDIPALLHAQLRSCGIASKSIFISPDCTICDFRFFSHRRQKAEAGRQLSFVAV